MADGVLRIKPDELTIGDLADFEKIAGVTFTTATRTDKDGNSDLSAVALLALVYIVKRKDDPNFTLDDARDVKLTELQIGEDKPDPTDAAS